MLRGTLPYLLGAFFLVPLLIWTALWSTGLGGPKAGFEDPLGNALFLVSIPFVLWFMIASLGSVANSMAGTSAFQVPRFAPARWLLRALPPATLVLGVAAGAYLLTVDGLRWAMLLPLGVALVFAIAIRKGEARRRSDEDGTGRAPFRLGAVARSVGRAVAAVPVMGWMIADAVRGDAAARGYFAFNLAVGWLVAVWWFGPMVIFWTALLLTPTVLVTLVVLTASR
ncbi:MAG: hypothetical protein AAFX81_03710 [Pseudomonadota bacterium]